MITVTIHTTTSHRFDHQMNRRQHRLASMLSYVLILCLDNRQLFFGDAFTLESPSLLFPHFRKTTPSSFPTTTLFSAGGRGTATNVPSFRRQEEAGVQLGLSSSSSSSSVTNTASSTSAEQPNNLNSKAGQKDEKNDTGDDDTWIRQVFEEEKQDPSVSSPNNKQRTTSILEESLIPFQDRLQVVQQQQDERQQFPFSLVVGNDLAKQALILAAANPKGLGSGVLLYGGHGTGKSVLCRAMRCLLVASNYYHENNHHSSRAAGNEGDKNDEQTSSSSTHAHTGTSANSVPFITVPLHCQEDALLGTVDLERSMKEGVAIFEAGLLARADGGILYVDDMHLLEEGLIHILLTAVTDGYVTIEREGISVRYPCRPILLASYNPTEGGDELQQHWADRIAITVPMTDSAEMATKDRVQVVEQVEAFVDKTISADELTELEEEETELRQAIISARDLLPQITLSKEQLLYLCQEASRADCEGQRAEIYAAEIARTSAALDGRVVVSASDLQRAVLLAIAPRGKAAVYDAENSNADEKEQKVETSDEDDASPPQQPQSPANMQEELPPQDATIPPEELDHDLDQQEKENQEIEEEGEHDEEDGVEQEELELAIPDRFMFGMESVSLDPRLLNFQQWTRKGKGGKRSKIFNLKRGRFIKSLIPKDWKVGKIAVGATLRAAAPYQKIRRKRATGTGSPKLVYVRNTDFRIKRMARKSGSLILFVVDSSGSMALNRMAAAKGAAMSLLKEAYKSRDKICLISFHDTQAEVLVPPTKSMALARNRLEAMPCGGKSPLAHALALAIRTGTNAVKVKQDVGKVVMVLLADGRANVPLCVSEGDSFLDATLVDSESNDDAANGSRNQQPSRVFLKEEVLAIAKQLGALKEFNLLCIDTEDKFVGTGMAKDLTRVAGGSYFHLTPSTTNAESIAHIAQQGVNDVRGK